MRNPDRLDTFYATIRNIHRNSFPDWRFGQLMSNFFDWLSYEKGVDLFFPEEDKMLEYFKEFANETSPLSREN